MTSSSRRWPDPFPLPASARRRVPGRVFRRLPGRVRDVFTLRRVYGLSQREVAQKLGIAESTVEKHMARGFLLMLEYFRDSGNPAAHPSNLKSGIFGNPDAKKDRTSD